MDRSFWIERWQRNEIGFHQPAPHAALLAHWDSLALARDARVFVPLAGKSLDLVWFAQRGQRVVGCELAPLAVESFFAERGLTPHVTQAGTQRRYVAGPFEMLCGDLFELDRATLEGDGGPIAGVFDRGALVALPPALRDRYARKMAELTTAGTRTLLVTMEYAQERMAGPPHAVLEPEVHALYGGAHKVRFLARNAVLDENPKFRDRGLDALAEAVYRLERL